MANYIDINGIKTAYEESGAGRDMLLLHGWGQNKEMMSLIQVYFQNYFHVVSIDFPGFGESDDPDEAWGVPDYEKHLEGFIEKLGLKDLVIVGHSFGCRTAIRYAAAHPVRKMCLTGAAGIRPKHDLGWHVRTKTYKAGKWLLKVTGNKEKLEELQKNSGSEDYRNAQGIMRQICDDGGAIFFSTHVLEVAEKLCDKVAIIRNGRLIRSGTMEEVRGDSSLESVFLELEEA